MFTTRRERLDRIAQRVMNAGGVYELSLEALRDAYGAERAGCHVRDGITRELARRGIEHLPRRLPKDQTHIITLFDTRTHAGRVIAGALELARLSAIEANAPEEKVA